MGTSKSSKGAPSGKPIVPPWTPEPQLPPDTQPPPDAPLPDDAPDGNEPNVETASPQQSIPLKSPLAPASRFGAARTSLGRFAGSGRSSDLRRGVGHYVSTGLGGASTAARRMGGSSKAASTLYHTLQSLQAGVPAGSAGLDKAVLQGKSAKEIAAAIVEAVRPVDGTQDAEASRNAIQGALSDLLTQNPNADLLNLSSEERWLVVERYLGNDIFSRINLDVGKAIQDKAPTATVAVQRLREVKDYVQQTVAAKLQKLNNKAVTLTKSRIDQVIRATITETFEVFASYS